MKIALVNSFFPPDSAITGRSLAEIVPHLRRRFPEDEIRVFAGAASYSGPSRKIDEDQIDIVRLGSSRRYSGKTRRFVQTLCIGRQLARTAVGWADVILSLTDPPLLGFWIGRERAKARRSVRWIEWTMDLYPEAFASAGLVGAGNPIYRFIRSSLRAHPPDGWICLGPEQSAAVTEARGQKRPTVILPCGICDPLREPEKPPAWRREENRLVIAYAGNLGEAHCPDLLPALVEAADERMIAFRFAVYGANAAALRRRLEACANVIWCESMSHTDLAFADVHVASLRPNWTHVCVPSKAVTTICLGRPLIFAGDSNSDTAKMLAEASWILPFPKDACYDRALIAEILKGIGCAHVREAKNAQARRLAVALGQEKERALSDAAVLVGGTTLNRSLEKFLVPTI